MAYAYEVVTFDCYGTLVDWEAGISSAIGAAVAQAGVTLDRRAIIDAYMEIEPAVEAEKYRPYRDVLAETARRVARRFGLAIDRNGGLFLPGSLPDWPLFPDTTAGLRQLSDAGIRIGILSNVDDDLIGATIARIDVPFDSDLVVTAERVASYKPAHGHFVEARRRIGGAPWLHAAQSWFHDVVPCMALDIPVAWVNRKGEPPPGDASPAVEVETVSRLADLLTSQPPSE